MTRERGLKVAVVVVLLVVTVLGAFVLRQRKTYHQWPWQALPDRLDHCHRSYAPGDDLESEDAPELTFDFHFEPALTARHDVYVEPENSSRTTGGSRVRWPTS